MPSLRRVVGFLAIISPWSSVLACAENKSKQVAITDTNNDVLRISLDDGCSMYHSNPEEFRIGLSASLTGPGCLSEEERDALYGGLALWRYFTQKADYKLLFCLEDDKGDQDLAVDIYKNFVAKNAAQMHMLLGPSNFAFRDAVAAALNGSSIILMLWSSPAYVYDMPMLPHSPSLTSSGRRLAPEPAQARGLSEEPSESDVHRDTAPAGDPDGKLWDLGHPFIFDLTVPESQTLRGAARMLRSLQLGAQTPKTIGIFRLADGTQPHASCEWLAQHAHDSELDYELLWNEVLRGTEDVLRVVKAMLFSGDVDVVVVCGSRLSVAFFINAAHMMGYSPRALLIGNAGSLDAIIPLNQVDCFLEPRPVPFLAYRYTAEQAGFPLKYRRYEQFDNFQEFYFKRFSSNDEDSLSYTFPRLRTLQLLAAYSVTSEMWENLGLGATVDAKIVAEHFSKLNKSRVSSRRTFVGNISFDEKGKCRTCESGAHQMWYNVSDADRRTVKWNDKSAEARGVNHSHLLAATIESTHDYPESWRPFLRELRYPCPTWLDRVDVPCKPGCMLGRLSGRSLGCQPCRKGWYRSEDDMQCVECEAGKFAAREGQSSCDSCPEGAVCSNTTEYPQSQPGYYRDDARLASEDRDRNLICSSADESETTNGNGQESLLFLRCTFESRCLGNNSCATGNVGVMCAQCDSSSSYFGLFPHLRHCTPCPSRFLLLVRWAAVLFVYIVAMCLVNYTVRVSASVPSSLTLPVLLVVLRHLQTVGIVSNLCRLDTLPGLFPTFPGPLGALFATPMQLLQLDCLDKLEEKPLVSLYAIYTYSIALCLTGYVAIVLLHVGSYVYMRGNTMGWKVWWSYIRLERDPDDTACRRAIIRECNTRAIRNRTVTGRLMTIWTLMVYPVMLNSWFFSVHCERQRTGMDGRSSYGVSRLYFHMEIECYEGAHQPLARQAWALFGVVGVGLPGLLGMWLASRMKAENVRDISVLHSIGFLSIGHVPSQYFFELLMMLRSLALIGVSAIDYMILRINLMVLILVAGATYLRLVRPRESSGRQHLLKLEQAHVASLLITAIVGGVQVVAEEGALDQASSAGAKLLGSSTWRETVSHIMAWGHIAVLAYAGWVVVYNRIIIPGFVALQAGVNIGCMARVLISLAQCFVELSTVNMVRDAVSGEYFLDTSGLEEGERKFMVLLFADTIQILLNSVDIVDARQPIEAVRESFIRASEHRAASLGTPAAKQKRRRVRIDSGSPGGVQNPIIYAAVTMDELQSAFKDVEVDIMMRRPMVHRGGHHSMLARGGAGRPSMAGKAVEQDQPWQMDDQPKRLDVVSLPVMTEAERQKGMERAISPNGYHSETVEDEVHGNSTEDLITYRDRGTTAQTTKRKLLRRKREAVAEIAALRALLETTSRTKLRSNYKTGAIPDEVLELRLQSLLADIKPPVATDMWELFPGPRPASTDDRSAAVGGATMLGVPSRPSNDEGSEAPLLPQLPGTEGGSSAQSIAVGTGGGNRAPPAAISLSPFAAVFGKSLEQAIAAAEPTRAAPKPIASPEEDSLELVFDAPFDDVEPPVFEAMVLNSLRNAGVPGEAIATLRVSQSDGSFTASVEGPTSTLAQLQEHDLTRLQVMGLNVVGARKRVGPETEAARRDKSRLSLPPVPPIRVNLAPTSDEARRLVNAFEGGRMVLAHRALWRCEALGEDPSCLLSPRRLELVRRIGSRFEDSLEMLDIPKDWFTLRKLQSLPKFGFRLGDDGTLRLTTSSLHPYGCPVRALAAFVELDFAHALIGPLIGDRVGAQRLGDHRVYKHYIDTTWHLVSKSHAFDVDVTEDRILQLSAVDALDEPISALWVQTSAVDVDGEGRTWLSARAIDPPKPKLFARRVDGPVASACIKQLRSWTGERWGFRLDTVVIAKPPEEAFKALQARPVEDLRAMLATAVKDFTSKLHKLASHSPSKDRFLLEDHMSASISNLFYQRCRHRLDERLDLEPEAPTGMSKHTKDTEMVATHNLLAL